MDRSATPRVASSSPLCRLDARRTGPRPPRVTNGRTPQHRGGTCPRGRSVADERHTCGGLGGGFSPPTAYSPCLPLPTLPGAVALRGRTRGQCATRRARIPRPGRGIPDAAPGHVASLAPAGPVAQQTGSIRSGTRRPPGSRPDASTQPVPPTAAYCPGHTQKGGENPGPPRFSPGSRLLARTKV